MPSEAPTHESNEQLREEFNRLRREQDARMKQAIYIGMTAEEAKEYEEVRNRLTELTTFDVPGAGTEPGQGTFAAINPAGVIAGNYLDANNVFHGFLLTP